MRIINIRSIRSANEEYRKEKTRKIIQIILLIARVHGRNKRTQLKVHVLLDKYYPYEERAEICRQKDVANITAQSPFIQRVESLAHAI